MGCASSSRSNIQVRVAPARPRNSQTSDPLGHSTPTVSSTAVIQTGLSSSGRDSKLLRSRPPSNTSASTGSVSSPPPGIYRCPLVGLWIL